MPDRVATARGGTAVPLTARQFRFWLWYLSTPEDERWFMHLVQFVDVPHGVAEQDAVAAVELVVARHDVLRTRFDLTGAGEMARFVDPAGPPPVHPVDADRPARDQNDLNEAAAALVRRPIDLSARWPLRVLLVRVKGQVRQLCLVVHHVAVDREALAVLRTELRAALTGRAPAHHADEGDPYRGETGDRARRRSEAAADHWRRTLPDLPAVVLPYHRDSSRLVQRLGWIDSPTLGRALPVLAARLNLSPPAIVLAAFDLALTAWTGLRRWRWETIVDNRPQNAVRGAVGCFIDPTLVNTEVDTRRSFADHARGVADALLVGLRHSVCDYTDLYELEVRGALLRGSNLDAPLIYNFKSAADSRPEPGDRPPDPVVDGGFSPAEVHWAQRHDPALLFVRVHRLGEVPRLSLAARDSLVPADDHRALLFAVEHVLWSAAVAPETAADRLCASAAAPRWPRRPDWTRLSGSRWVDLPATEEVLRTYDAVDDARCAIHTDAAGSDALHARLHVSDLDRALRALRDHHRGMLYQAGVLVPDRVILHGPGGATAHWSPHDPPPAAGPGSAAERALVEHITAVSGRRPASLDLSLLEQGGRAADLIGLHRRLADSGWDGVAPKDLLGPATLRGVARRLTRTADPTH